MTKKGLTKKSELNGEASDLWKYGPQPGQVIKTWRGKGRVLCRRYGVATVQLEDGDIAYLVVGRRIPND